MSKISDDYFPYKEEERVRFNRFYNLFNYNNESKIQSLLKEKLLKEISKLKNKTVTNIETFFLSSNSFFGNGLIALNNAIFYCEVVGCHNIILNENQTNRKWLIVNPIYIEKLNITIFQDKNVDCKNNNILCIYEIHWQIYYPIVIIPQLRTQFLKEEILNNLPYVNVKPDDLYIHIRGGDIFQPNPLPYYAQPPLCFYEKIIHLKCFNNIYIVSMDKLNIIVDALTKKHENIIYKKNCIEYDISLLSHAYNIVASVSSFALSSIKINDNLKNLWEYDIMRLGEKFLFLHHHISNINIKYNIYTMKPSDIYQSKMFLWKGTSEQIKLMLEDDCPYNFTLTRPKT